MDHAVIGVTSKFLTSPHSSCLEATILFHLEFSGATIHLVESAATYFEYDGHRISGDYNILTELKKVINIDYWLELKDRDDRQVTEDLHVLTQLSQEAQECLARGSIPDDVMKEKVYDVAKSTYGRLSTLLKEPFIFGQRPTSLDAKLIGHLMALSVLPENSKLKEILKEFENLLRYMERQGLNHQAETDSIHPALRELTQPPVDRKPKEYKIYQIQYMTQDLNEEIAQGTFGKVYKGQTLGAQDRNRAQTAVKVAVRKDTKLTEYHAEIRCGEMLRHKNFTKLLGYCQTEKQLILISEYMPNKTLADKLEDLDWPKTMKIIKGLCNGIHFMHNNIPTLVNPDLKVNNILLDKDFNTKITDYGWVLEESQHMPVGTPKYTDPTILWGGIATKKTDMHNFGVILLELLTKNLGLVSGLKAGEDILRLVEEGRVQAHEALVANGCTKDFEQRIINVIVRCVHPNLDARPSMSDVIDNLAKVMTK